MYCLPVNTSTDLKVEPLLMCLVLPTLQQQNCVDHCLHSNYERLVHTHLKFCTVRHHEHEYIVLCEICFYALNSTNIFNTVVVTKKKTNASNEVVATLRSVAILNSAS